MTMSSKFNGSSESALFMAYKEYAEIALQTIFLMNGGAAVALLAYMGDLKNSGRNPEIYEEAIMCFVGGVGAGV